jgi:hypothetical protein
MSTVLRLERAGTLWRARRRMYDVVLDGATVATVANAEATSIAIAPGHHVVWLTGAKRRSGAATFAVASGETAAFRCRAGIRGGPVLEPDPTAAPRRAQTSRPSLRRPA